MENNNEQCIFRRNQGLEYVGKVFQSIPAFEKLIKKYLKNATL